MKVGYFVKKEGEDLESKLIAHGCEKVFSDKDETFKKRKNLKNKEDHIRKGDTLVISSLLNFGLTAKELIKFVNDLLYDGIEFHCIEDHELNCIDNQIIKNVIHKLYEIDIAVIKDRRIKGSKFFAKGEKDTRRKRDKISDTEKYSSVIGMYKAGKTYAEIMEVTEIKSTSTIKKYIDEAGLDKRNVKKSK